MFLLSSFCNDPDVLQGFYVLLVIGKIVFVILPIIILLRAIVPFAKKVFTGEEFIKFIPGVLKSIFAGILVYFLPSLFSYFFGLVVDAGGLEQMNLCFSNANPTSIELYRNAQAIEDEEERKKTIESLNEAIKEKKSQEAAYNKSLSEYNKKRVEKKKAEEAANNQSSSNGSSSPGSSSGASSVPAGTYTIHIGDSRTVGLCATITGSYNGCSYSSGGAKTYGNDIFIAEGSKGYSWFVSTAVPAVNKIISENPGTTYNIISYMGVNFLLSDIDKYIPKYNELAGGSWSKQNIILVSVNPVDEQIEAQHGYSTKNANIITFNTKLKNGISSSNLRYCDTYNAALANLSTSDGLHYGASTYQTIYNTAKSCI